MHYHASPDILNAFGAVSTRRRCLILTRSLENNSMVVRLMLCNMKRLHELGRNACYAKQGRHTDPQVTRTSTKKRSVQSVRA